jgi:sulfhydrogenase subunit beta (sulfur reductase)
MMIKEVGAAGLNAWVDGLVQKHKVFGVQARGDRFAFAPIQRAADLRLDYDVTLTPPKAFFQPPREALWRFDGDTWESAIENEPFVLFGVHPYDMAAISQMDEVFSDKNADVHYLERRKSATVVVCDVQNASPNVFAGCMGTATVKDGYDVLITKIADYYLIEGKSKKGEQLMAALAREPDADPHSLKFREVVWEFNGKLLRRHELKVRPAELPDLLERSYEHPVWAEKAKRCHSCGSCNLVCPTCYCFNVQDDVQWDLKHGERVRTWDGCMLLDFAKVAGGHNFRKNRAERYRHRYYRKGKFLWDQHKQIACVGCGRCITACTTKIANPVDVYNRLLEAQ